MLELQHHDVVGITEILMNTMEKLFAELEADLLVQFQSLTPKQLEIEEHRRKLQRQYEASLNNVETDEDRADTDEYPEDDDEVGA
jgi:hypothetical protein